MLVLILFILIDKQEKFILTGEYNIEEEDGIYYLIKIN